VAGGVHLGCVDDDHVIASVGIRGELGLVLAAEAACDFGSQSAEGLAIGVDKQPVALGGFAICEDGFHWSCSSLIVVRWPPERPAHVVKRRILGGFWLELQATQR